MKVCHRCGTKNLDDYCVHINIRHHNSYTYTQDFDLCVKCKDAFLDKVSVVISDSQTWMKPPKEKPKTTTKKNIKSKKNKK